MLADRIRNWPLIRPKDGTPQKGGRGESERDRERREKGRLSRTDGENYHTCCQHIALLMSNWICSLAGAIPPHARLPYSPSSAATGYYVGGITTVARGCEATNSSVNFTWTDNFTQFVRADEQSFPICMRLRVAPTNSHAPINTQPTAHFSPFCLPRLHHLRVRLSVWRCQLGISASITFREHTKNPSFVWFSHDKLATCHAPTASTLLRLLSAASFGRVFTSFPKCNWNNEQKKVEAEENFVLRAKKFVCIFHTSSEKAIEKERAIERERERVRDWESESKLVK